MDSPTAQAITKAFRAIALAEAMAKLKKKPKPEKEKEDLKAGTNPHIGAWSSANTSTNMGGAGGVVYPWDTELVICNIAKLSGNKIIILEKGEWMLLAIPTVSTSTSGTVSFQFRVDGIFTPSKAYAYRSGAGNVSATVVAFSSMKKGAEVELVAYGPGIATLNNVANESILLAARL